MPVVWRARRTPILHEHLNGILALSRNADSRHSNTTSVIPYLHGAIPMPIALLCAACTAATAPSPMRSPLPTEHKVAPLTHHFTDGQFCDHTRRRPISGQRKHASRSRSRPKSHRPSEPSPRRIRPPCPRQRETSELDIAADSPSERCVCPSSPPHASCGTRAAKVDKTR